MLGWLILIIEIGAIISSVLMVFLILLQEPKSGGLAMLGGSGLSNSMGVSNPLRRATVYLSIFFMAGALLLAIYQSMARRDLHHTYEDETPAAKLAKKTPGATTKPTTPAAAEPLYIVKMSPITGDMTKVAAVVSKITGEKDMAKVTEKMASGVIAVAPKAKAEEYKKELEANGAKVELTLETPPPAPLGTAQPSAEPNFMVMLTDVGANPDAVKAAIGEITGEKDPAKLEAKLAGKLITVDKLPQATDAQLKLEKAGAKVTVTKLETPAPATTPPATTPETPATPATPAKGEGAGAGATTPPATTPATAPTTAPATAPTPTPAPAPAH